VKNFNVSQERVIRQFAIGKEFFDIPVEERLKYVPEGLCECVHNESDLCR